MMQTRLETEERGNPEHALCLIKQPAPEGPTALPTHILAVGEHHQIADSQWWMGYARAAYEEVAHLQGIIIYNRTIHIFLKREEVSQAYLLLPELIQQGQALIGRVVQQQKELAL